MEMNPRSSGGGRSGLRWSHHGQDREKEELFS